MTPRRGTDHGATWAAAALLALTACSDGATRPVPDPREAALLRPPLATPDPRGLRALRPVPWDEAAYVGPWALDVHYVTGVPACYRLAEVRVVETAETVTITLVDGTPPRPAGTMCLAIGFSARTRVTLDALLGDRRLVDGATGEARELRTY